MKKIAVLVVGLLVVLVVGGLIFLSRNQETPTTTSLSNSDSSPTNLSEDSSGNYLVYSEAAYLAAADKKRVLFFYANWCPICAPVNVEIQRRSAELPDNLVILRVNYNDSDTDEAERALAQKYGITYQHTFVLVDSAGRELKKWNGGDLDQILDMVG